MNARNPNTPFKPRRDDILFLRKKGLSYKQIAKKLGCSKATISFHCGKDKSEKKRVRQQSIDEGYSLAKKLNNFKSKCSKKQWIAFRTKVKSFKKKKKNKLKNPQFRKAGTTWRVHNVTKNYTVKDVINKIGDSPICYLTGRKINLSEGKEFSLDHRLPTAKGGTNDLENLEICCTLVNRAKTDMTLGEFYSLCEEVLAWRDKNK